MGVHLGDVRAEGDRIFGNGVNVAARLQALAEPGGLCISDAVRQEVAAKLALSLEDLGAKELKNLPEPVRVFRVHVVPARRASVLGCARASSRLASSSVSPPWRSTRAGRARWVFSSTGVGSASRS